MKRQTIIILGICIISLLATCISYFYLPEQIPIHFDIDFQPDRYTNKEWIFLIGSSPLLCYLSGKFLKRIEPMKTDLRKNIYVYDILISILSLLFLGMNWVTIYFSFEEHIKNTERFQIFPFFFGLCLILLGNYLPIVRKNYFLGIRTPFTLQGEISWKKTNRLGGYLFVTLGLLLCLGGILGNKQIYIATFVWFLLGVLLLFIYSYFIYCKYDKK